MEKLLKLLNEYMFVDTSACEHLYNKDVETIYVRTTLETGEIDDERVRDERIISKRFGFIKWLVDNDKINREKIDGLELIPTLTYQNMIDDCDCGKSHWHPYTFVGDEYELLMLLAISDTPIDDLISYLK